MGLKYFSLRFYPLIPLTSAKSQIDKHTPVHIFDSHNISIILGELDTVTDLSNYLDEKLRAIKNFDELNYCGEEDLLAHYLINFDKKNKRHVIGSTEDGFNIVMIGEGQWLDFINSDLYRNTKKENKVSYLWDGLIQRTCQNALEERLGGNSDLMRGSSAIFEMVKEPRYFRRSLADKINQAVLNFPDYPEEFTRQVTFLPSYIPDVGYVFFQFRVPANYREHHDYLDKRRTLLEIACGAAKNKFSHLKKVVGIGIDAPKFAGQTNSEDFILLHCEAWGNDMRTYYEEQNQEWKFFGTEKLKRFNEHVTEFVPLPTATPVTSKTNSKFGRNEPCPCGSGKKYKKCHGA